MKFLWISLQSSRQIGLRGGFCYIQNYWYCLAVIKYAFLISKGGIFPEVAFFVENYAYVGYYSFYYFCYRDKLSFSVAFLYSTVLLSKRIILSQLEKQPQVGETVLELVTKTVTKGGIRLSQLFATVVISKCVSFKFAILWLNQNLYHYRHGDIFG